VAPPKSSSAQAWVIRVMVRPGMASPLGWVPVHCHLMLVT
jgi:hypothetical protein